VKSRRRRADVRAVTTTCAHGFRGDPDPGCARCSTPAGTGLHYRSARADVEGRQWTRTAQTATTMGLPGRVAWTAAILLPSVPGIYLLAAHHLPFGALGPFFSLLAGAAALPDVWARGRR
jgi:hypothetical protein